MNIQPQKRGSENRSFLREWASAPLRVAAIAPSSPSLARIMTSEIGSDTGPVIELGPGTGVFTKALLERGVRPADLALVELSVPFAARLKEAFPRVTVHNGSAADLAQMDFFDGRQTGAVVSGLGLLAMPDDLVLTILSGVFRNMAPGGAMYQFTYSPRPPVKTSLQKTLGLRMERIGRTLRNLPPASVYRVRKAG